MARKNFFDQGTTLFVMQIVVAAYLILLGLLGIVYWNSAAAQFGRGLHQAFGRSVYPVNLILSIVELAAGVIVLLGLFAALRRDLLFVTTLVIAIIWAVLIVVNFFGRGSFGPNFLVWLSRLAADLIVLLALWLINRKYA